MKWIQFICILCILAIIGVAAPAAAQTPTPDYRQMSPVGSILLWTGNYTPPGWLALDGSCIAITGYPELYALIGYSFTPPHSCNPGTTFGLPDLRNRVPIGEGQNPYNPSNQTFGAYGGHEVISLTVTEMPAHNHNLVSSAGILLYSFGAGAAGRNGLGVTAGTNTTATRLTTESKGAGGQFSLMNPFVVVRYIINAGTSALVLPPTVTPQPTSTPAPTATSAPTATPQPTWTLEAGMITTPRPEIVYYSTMEANGTYQAVAFEYSFTAGDAMVSILLIFTCGLLALGMVMRARGGKA